MFTSSIVPAQVAAITILVLFSCTSCRQAVQVGDVKHDTNWKRVLSDKLDSFGHRNWIVIADSAYPKQSANGIDTVVTGAGQLEVLKTVLEAVKDAPHVQATVLVDQELSSVNESVAPGVQQYRDALAELLEGKNQKTMPHDDIIGELDEASKLFNVLLLKSDMTIPYTSVFLRLECGYWDAEREARLRDSLQD